jgi:hypothetical protein
MRRLPLRILVVPCIHCRWWITCEWPARPRPIYCRHCGGHTRACALEIEKVEGHHNPRVLVVVYRVPVERVDLPPL